MARHPGKASSSKWDSVWLHPPRPTSKQAAQPGPLTPSTPPHPQQHAGKYRKWDKCVDDAGYANEWQIEAMPLRASECNSWYDACKDDYFCTCTKEVRTPKELFTFLEP